MIDPLNTLPPHLQADIRRIWQTQVTGGSARFKANGDRSGVSGQRAISQLLKATGIGENDPRWSAIIDHGRALYYGRSTPTAPPRPASSDPSPLAMGPVYTSGSSFRARAEANQRRFRVEELRAGHGRYGHMLDDEAIAAGATFLHPAARANTYARMAAGKGVDRPRTFGNMLSSQAMCFNLFGPLAADLELARDALTAFVPGLTRVKTIELEYTPPFDVFRDQSGYAGVDCDVRIDFETDGAPGVLVIETKFVEETFSSCGHRKADARDPCPDDVVIGRGFQGCRYPRKNGYLYWQRSSEMSSLRLPLPNETGCPFEGPLWQIWVNHTLAHMEAARRNAARVGFAVCAPRANDTLAAEARLNEFRDIAADSSTLHFIPLEEIIPRLELLVGTRDAVWRTWALQMRQRYLGPDAAASTRVHPSRQTALSRPSAVTQRHRRVVDWMGTPEFGSLVAAHREACGGRASIYFRPTDDGLVRIGLHPDAPCYVGFRTHADDTDFTITVPSRVPSVAEIGARLAAFEAWLPVVRRRSTEERGVIPWLAHALEDQLRLIDLGDGWVFLHQEWRFVGDGGPPKKTDILAVHVPSGRLVALHAR